MTSYFNFIVKSSLADFGRNKGRTILTSLGILIGVMSVVLLISFGLGLKKYIQQQFDSLGTNLLTIIPGQILQNGRFSDRALSTKQFTEKDMMALRRIAGTVYVVPMFQKNTIISANGNSESSQLTATSEEIFPSRNWNAYWGENFSKEDVRNRRKVAVLGPKIAQKLFGDEESAIGKRVKTEDQSYQVIGVLESKGGGGLGGPDFDSFTFIPYTAGYTFNPNKTISAFTIKVDDNYDIQKIKEEVSIVMLKNYKGNEFSVVEQKEIIGAIDSIFGVLNTVLIAIAAISLVVGGIGILNIMYVTVTERVKEIGIRRAIGARRNDILYQFLFEAIALSLLGGLSGLGLSALIVLAIQRFFPAYISIGAIALSLGVSSAIGIIFGVFPAKKAADLSPMEAIRYE